MSSSSLSGMESAIDIGDVGGEDGGRGEDVCCLLNGSSDIDGRVCVIGEFGMSEMEDAVEGRL